jgi:hypothetical protein
MHRGRVRRSDRGVLRRPAERSLIPGNFQKLTTY